MFNKMLGLMKEGLMRKTAVILFIALFVVFCSVGVYAEEVKTRVDKEKFDKLTPEQKKEFVERAKEARDTYLGSVRDHDAVAKEAEKAKKQCEWVEKTAVKVEIGLATVATGSSPTGIASGIAAVEAVDPIFDSINNKNESKK